MTTNFILDANVASDLLRDKEIVWHYFEQAREDKNTVLFPEPALYKVMRGLVYANATNKTAMLNDELLTRMALVNVTFEDWASAWQLWAQTRRAGKQFSDADLLIAAITQRVNGTLVTADDDFASLSIDRFNWRQ